MSFVENVKKKVGDAVGTAKDEHRAHEEKAESDIEADPKVAGSRADDEEDGSYVGRTNPQFDAETQESGAEARAEADRPSTH